MIRYRKIYLVLIISFILSINLFVNASYDDDDDMIYDVENISYIDATDTSGDKIVLSGWAYIKYYHQCGSDSYSNTANCDYGIDQYRSGRDGISRYYYNLGYAYKDNVNDYINYVFVYLKDSDGNMYADAVTMGSRSNVNLHSWNCYAEGKYCTGPRYANLGFTATIDMDMLESDKTYSLYIMVGLVKDGNQHIGEYSFDDVYDVWYSRELGMYSVNAGSTTSDTTKNFTNGSKVTINNLSTSAYFIASSAQALILSGGSFNYQYCSSTARATFANRVSYTIRKASELDSKKSGIQKNHLYGIKLYYLYSYQDGCTIRNGGSYANYLANAAWLKTSSAITIKYSGRKYCNASLIDSNEDITDCNGSYTYSCNDNMTIYAGDDKSKKVDVLPSEKVKIYLDDDYKSMNIYSGSGFKFGITYEDTVSYKITNKYGKSIDNSLIFSTLKSSYYNRDNLVNNISKLEIQDVYLSNKSFSGNWECEDESVEYSADGLTMTIKNKCKFVLNKTYYNHSKGEITNDYLDTYSKLVDGYYYTGDKYCKSTSSGGGKYYWNVTSNGVDLSTLKVQIDRSTSVPINITVDTNNIESTINDEDNSTTCYINVKNYFYSCDLDDTSSGSRFAFNYRSIDVSNPFPNITDSSKYPYNWKVFYDDNGSSFARINNSYDDSKLEYKTKVLSNTLLDSINDMVEVYDNWSDMDLDGNSSLVNGTYFDKFDYIHCGLGLFDNTCDWKGR